MLESTNDVSQNGKLYCPYLLYPGTGTCCKPGGTRQACAGCPR
jgi:hypothetical protein